ncbi:glycosyltransferase [Rubritalea marina]|uniref:glycosyltransferase n=1 Tax=Rubritalea marina TaxID=361055 RepID=UPI0014612E09|nr:glycosyltransferase [Rubritalea marina]
MKVAVFSPYALDSPKGNSVTAKRLEQLLATVGHSARAVDRIEAIGLPDALIALHAIHSLDASRHYKQQRPEGRLLIYLTGTDIYEVDRASLLDESLEMADALIVSQAASLESIPERHRPKAVLVPASVVRPKQSELPTESDAAGMAGTRFCFVGHLREVKNPFLVNRALAGLEDPVAVLAMGTELESGYTQRARAYEAADRRYRYLGNVPHAEAMAWMRAADFTLNTSFSEGGANAVAESIVLGTPVLASRIEGNVGMLGAEYMGYFEPGSAQSLEGLMRRVIRDQSFAEALRQQARELAQCFRPEAEIAALDALLSSGE